MSAHGAIFISRGHGRRVDSSWRGSIFVDSSVVWRGDHKPSRSAAFSQMVQANDKEGFNAVLKKPLPDKHPV